MKKENSVWSMIIVKVDGVSVGNVKINMDWVNQKEWLLVYIMVNVVEA